MLNAKTRKENTDQPDEITLHGEIVVRASSAPTPADRDKEVMPILEVERFAISRVQSCIDSNPK